MIDADTELWLQWRSAAAISSIDTAIRELFADLAAEITKRGPICWTSGRCCNFNAFGHRLYVTGLEIAWTLKQIDRVTEATQVDLNGPCPFQVNKLCSVHTIRPLGCRIFFCQQGTQNWQHEVYERFLGRLRVLHDQHEVPYRYMEWRTGLREALIAFTANRAIPRDVG